MSPQIKAALIRAFWVVIWGLVPIVVGVLGDLGTELTGTAALVAVLVARALEGVYDDHRNKVGAVSKADVGAYLPPINSTAYAYQKAAQERHALED